MVTNVTSFGRSGLSDFVLQRVSAVVLGAFGLCVGGWFAMHADAGHAAFAAWFSSPAMVVFATLSVAALVAHAWIGMWTVGTDYLRPHYFGRASTVLRLAYQGGTAMLLFLYLVWALSVIWGVGAGGAG